MISSAANVPLIADQMPSKTKRVGLILWECVIKELGSCFRFAWNLFRYKINPCIYGLNPTMVDNASKLHQKAKIVLLLHGAGSHPACFIPLAKKLANANIKNVYTVSLNQTDEDPVPINDLATKVDDLRGIYLDKGYSEVNFVIVGHSLGALVGSKYIWRGVHELKNVQLISVAGRLNYIHNRFFWFCKDVKPEIEETYEAICENPNKASLFTIWGDKDAIVPKQSAHIQGENSREFTVKNWGHAGIIYAPETHDIIVSLCKKSNGPDE
jgi:pimeloyl-ACP methyl ester carboxylesterase